MKPTQVTWHLNRTNLLKFCQIIYTALGNTGRLEWLIFGGRNPLVVQTVQHIWQQLLTEEPTAPRLPSSSRRNGRSPQALQFQQQGFRCRGRSRIYYARPGQTARPRPPVSSPPPVAVAARAGVLQQRSREATERPSTSIYQIAALTDQAAGVLLVTQQFCLWLEVQLPTAGVIMALQDGEPGQWPVTLFVEPETLGDRLNLAALQRQSPHLWHQVHRNLAPTPALDSFWRAYTTAQAALPWMAPPALSSSPHNLLQAVMEHSPLGVMQVALDGGILQGNPALCRMVGYTAAQLRRLDWQTLTPSTEFALVRSFFQQAIAHQEHRIFEQQFCTAPGNTLQVEVKLTLVGDPETDDSYLLAFVTDLSDRQALEAERQQAAQAIQQRQDRETVLNNLALRIRSTLDLTTMLQSATEELQVALKADRVVVYQIFPDASGQCVAESVHPGYPTMQGQQFGADCIPPPYLGAYGSGRLWSVDDVSAAGLTDCHREMLEQVRTQSMVATGILSMDDSLEPEQRTLWGLLTVHQCATRRDWTPDELQLIQAVANQLAIALEQTKLINQIHRYTQALEAEVERRTQSLQHALKFEQFTRTLAECLNHHLDETHLFTQIAQGLRTTLNADLCVIGFYVPETNSFHIHYETLAPYLAPPVSLLGQTVPLPSLGIVEFTQFCQGRTVQYTGDLTRTTLVKQVLLPCLTAHPDYPAIAVHKIISPILGNHQQLIGAVIVAQVATTIPPEALTLIEETTNYCAIALRQTTLYQQEHEQRLSAEYLRSFLETSIDIFVEYDAQHRYLSINPAGCTLLNLSREDILGKTNRELVGTAADSTEQALQQAIATGEKVFIDHELHMPQGIRVFETIFAPITAPNGNVQRIIMVSRDVTDLKDQWQLLETRNQQLAENNRLKQEFVATTSHELRTPLTAILGFSNVLLQEFFGELNPKQRDYLERIHESGQHLLDLINDILDLSRLEAGRMELDLQAIYIVDICEGVMNLVQERATEQGLTLQLEIAPEVEWITADPRRLKQMLLNLLSNAVKFTPKGSVGLRVYRRSRSPEYADCFADRSQQAILAIHDIIHFQVWDTGIGIHELDQRLLFAPFSQIDNSLSRQHQGTGLGLVITRKLAELHGGWVTLDSHPGQGSTFTISIPVRLSL